MSVWIDAAAGRIRYDTLPRGPAQLELDAINSGGVIVYHGLASFDSEPNAAPTPAAIDLR